MPLAAATSEVGTERALAQLLETGVLPVLAAVRDVVSEHTSVEVPWLCPPTLNLGIYDQLLAYADSYYANVIRHGSIACCVQTGRRGLRITLGGEANT